MITTIAAYFCGFVIVPGMIGAGISWTAFSLLTAIRGRTNSAASKKKVALFVILVFVVTFGLYSYFWAWEFVGISAPYDYECEGVTDPGDGCNETLGTKELWLRIITPFGLAPDCYSDKAEVCRSVDMVVDGNSLVTFFLWSAGSGLVSALASRLSIWRWTRLQIKQKENFGDRYVG